MLPFLLLSFFLDKGGKGDKENLEETATTLSPGTENPVPVTDTVEPAWDGVTTPMTEGSREDTDWMVRVWGAATALCPLMLRHRDTAPLVPLPASTLTVASS